MTLLVGSETEGLAASSSVASETSQAFQFTASASGTLQIIKFHTSTVASTATSVVVGVVEDLLGSPGTILGGEEATFTGTPGENVAVEVSGLSTAITSGTLYWLCLLANGGALKIKRHKTSEGSNKPSKTSTIPAKVKKISEVTVWGANEEASPMFIAGLTGAEVSGLSMLI
jgi:hypothetical protein